MKTREELENLINDSPLFSIDRDADTERFVNEERRFLSDLAELMSIIRKDFSEIGLEIIETARSCIRSYNAERGAFLNNYNKVLGKNLHIAKAKEKADNYRGGLTFDEKTERTILQILKYAKKCGGDIRGKNFQEKIAGALDIPLKVVSEVIITNDFAVAQSGNRKISNDDNNESELFDLIQDTNAESVEDTVINFEFTRETLVSIDTAFKTQQERTKPLLKKLLTARTIKALDDANIIAAKMTRGLEFFDDEIYSGYLAHGKIPHDKDIAAEFGVLDASASRTLKNFLEKVRGKC